ncbi:TetR/AcrR family transcriptional regulator [Streptomyces sp. NPDC006385]|uniref:TetR/AcrR family transcriptional regulator n=1 Tax=Streptomyces sp. NPDC006385 TaxID=3156761 RepID=UPI0033BDAE32
MESHNAIIEATLTLVGEVGYQRLTLDAVARRAGVGKATIYRWWPNKCALVAESLKSGIPQREIMETGDLATDLRTEGRLALAMAWAPHLQAITPALIADMLEDPAEAGHCLEFLQPCRATLLQLMENARDSGRLPPEADTALMADIYAGTVAYRALLRREPLTETTIDQIVDLLLHGTAPTHQDGETRTGWG